MALVDSSGNPVRSGTGGTVNSSGGGGGGGGAARRNRAAERKRIKEAKAAKAKVEAATKAREAQTRSAAADKRAEAEKRKKSAERLAAAKAGAAEDARIEAETKRIADKIAKETAESNAAKAAKDKAAKVKAYEATVKKREDKKEYDKGIALAARKAQVKRENAAKKRNEEAKIKTDRGFDPKAVAAEIQTDRGFDPNVAPVERMPTNDGVGMLGAGEAYYPTGKGETLEDNIPTSMLGKLSSVLNPTEGIISTAGQTFLNQVKYGMNEEASNLYQELLQDPAHMDKTTEELVQMARKPQMDRQKPHAYINKGGANTANEAQLAAMRPEGITEKQWAGLPITLQRILTQKEEGNTGNAGMLTGEATAPEAPEAPTLGQLTTGGYTPTERPAWAPQPSIYDNIMPNTQQPSFAPQWNPQAPQPSFAPQWSPQRPQPSWAPKARSMLGAPMRLQAPPSRFLK